MPLRYHYFIVVSCWCVLNKSALTLTIIVLVPQSSAGLQTHCSSQNQAQALLPFFFFFFTYVNILCDTIEVSLITRGVVWESAQSTTQRLLNITVHLCFTSMVTFCLHCFLQKESVWVCDGAEDSDRGFFLTSCCLKTTQMVRDFVEFWPVQLLLYHFFWVTLVVRPSDFH